MTGKELFDRAVSECSLGMVGPFVVSRILLRVKVFSPDTLTPQKLFEALPHLEEALRLYLQPQEAAAALKRVRALAPSDDR